MPRFAVTRNNFLGGELSIRADGRTDIPQYNLGCKQIRNFIPMPSGGITRRPGTRFIDKVRGVSTNELIGVRIIPFVFSSEESYVLIIWIDNTSLLTRFRVFESGDLSAVFNEQTVVVSGSFPPDYINTDLNKIQYVQSADVMYLCVDGFEPFVVYRTGSVGSYTFNVSRYIDGTGFGGGDIWLRVPYLGEETATTITPSATTGSVTLTASSGIFTAANIGSFYRIEHGATIGYARVTAYTSPTQVTATVLVTLGGTGASDAYAESAWSDRRGFPRSVTFYNRRLLFGGSTSRPDTFWASQTSDFYQFEPIGTGPSDPQAFTLSSDRLNEIQWMNGGKKLTIGTTSGEHVGEFREDGTEIFVQFFQETTHGSAYIQPQRVGYAIPFIQRSQRRVRELVFDFNSDSYVANDLTLLKEDIAEGYWNLNYDENKIINTAYTETPFPCVWAFDDSGKLYSCTRERNQQIAAWATHVIGGTLDGETITGFVGSPDYHARVVSICSTPSPDNTYDRLFLVVQRDIDGATDWYLEYMDKFRSEDQFSFNGANVDSFFYFLDSSKGVYSGSLIGTFSGFDHLKNETVSVMADSKYIGELTVNNAGEITLPNGTTANRVVAGYQYKSRVKTMRQEGGSAIGSSTGAIRRVDQVRLNVLRGRFFSFGFENDDLGTKAIKDGENQATQTDAFDSYLEPYEYTDPSEVTSAPFYGVSDIISLSANDANGKKGIFILLVDKPYPFSLLSVTMRAVENDV
jgi:hypothetical protein